MTFRLLGLALALTPLIPAQDAFAPVARTPKKPVFVAEFGLSYAQAEPQLREGLLSFLRQLDEDGNGLRPLLEPPALPARLRIFAAPGIEAIEQSQFLLSLDLPRRIDLSKLGPEGMRPQPVAGNENLFQWDHWTLRWVPGEADSNRLLMSSGYDLRGELPGWMQELEVPRMRKAAQRLLQKARAQYGYLFVYAGALQRHIPTLRQQGALVGPDGLALAVYLHQIKGHFAYTMDWGMGLGSGVLGSALPKDAGDAQVLAATQDTSDFEYYANLGSGGPRFFSAILGVVQANWDTDEEKQIAELFSTLLADCDGRLAMKLDGRDGPEGGGIGCAGSSAENLLRKIHDKLKALPALKGLETGTGEGAATLRGTVDGRELSIQPHAEHLSFRLGKAGKTDAKDLASRQRLLAVLSAPFKVWIAPSFLAEELASARQRIAETPGTTKAEQTLQQGLLAWFGHTTTQGLLLTADWDKHGLRISYIFGTR